MGTLPPAASAGSQTQRPASYSVGTTHPTGLAADTSGTGRLPAGDVLSADGSAAAPEPGQPRMALQGHGSLVRGRNSAATIAGAGRALPTPGMLAVSPLASARDTFCLIGSSSAAASSTPGGGAPGVADTTAAPHSCIAALLSAQGAIDVDESFLSELNRLLKLGVPLSSPPLDEINALLTGRQRRGDVFGVDWLLEGRGGDVPMSGMSAA